MHQKCKCLWYARVGYSIQYLNKILQIYLPGRIIRGKADFKFLFILLYFSLQFWEQNKNIIPLAKMFMVFCHWAFLETPRSISLNLKKIYFNKIAPSLTSKKHFNFRKGWVTPPPLNPPLHSCVRRLSRNSQLILYHFS